MTLDTGRSIREARALLMQQLVELEREAARIRRAVEALDEVLGPEQSEPRVYEHIGTGSLHFGGAAKVEFVPAKQTRRTSIRPALVEVMGSHPGVHHANDITQWVGQRVKFTAANPLGSIVTALMRMRDAGQVEFHGDNRWEWIGGEAVAPDEADTGQPPVTESGEGTAEESLPMS